MNSKIYFKIFLTFLISIFLYCATTQEFQIFERTDKFNPGVVKIESSAITLKDVKLLDTSWLMMQPSYAYKDTYGIYALSFIYSAKDWAFFDNLKFLIDGEVLSFSEKITSDRDVGSMSIGETIVFQVTEDLFKKISNANSVSLRISGQKKVLDYDLSIVIINNLKTFYSAVLEKTGK